MKQIQKVKNVKVVIENTKGGAGFDIFLDFSGRKEFLMHHRHEGFMYMLLKDGMYLDELHRWKPSRFYRRDANNKIRGMVNHLLSVADCYVNEQQYERAECGMLLIA